MKKILALLLVLVMALSLVACGGSDSKEPADNAATGGYNYDAIPNEMTAEDGKYQIAFVTDVGTLMDMADYEELAPRDEWGCMIHPLPLLTSVGNGRGGGDYRGTLQDEVGTWAGDLIETQDVKPNGYTDATDWFFFEEGR